MVKVQQSSYSVLNQNIEKKPSPIRSFFNSILKWLQSFREPKPLSAMNVQVIPTIKVQPKQELPRGPFINLSDEHYDFTHMKDLHTIRNNADFARQRFVSRALMPKCDQYSDKLAQVQYLMPRY